MLVAVGGVLLALVARPLLPGLSGRPTDAPVLRPTGEVPMPDQSAPAFSYLRFRQLLASSPQVKRLAFLADYDERSIASLKRYATELDGIIPDWLTLADAAGGVRETDSNEHEIHRWLRAEARTIEVYPLLSSTLSAADTATAIATPDRRRKLAAFLAEYLRENRFAGVTLSLHQLPPSSHASLMAFLSDLRRQLQRESRKILVMVWPGYDAARLRQLADRADHVLIGTFDATHGRDAPGAVASQGWFEAQLAELRGQIDPAKLIIGIGSYGYEWDGAGVRRQVSVQTAWNRMEQASAPLVFDARTLNPGFGYRAADGLKHEVWFLDGVTVFNQTRAALALKPAALALWRLGLEDPSAWLSFGHGRRPDQQTSAALANPLPGYDIAGFAPGDALAVESRSGAGRRAVTFHSSLGLITRQSMQEIPGSFRMASWGAQHERTIALTFDDGPDDTYTPAILDILRDKSVKATFFVIGRNGLRSPHLLQRIYDEGHDLGNHTFSHPDLRMRTASEMELELTATQRVLESQLGIRTVLFRAPRAHRTYGSEPDTARVMETATRLGYVSIRVSIEPHDWAALVTAKQVRERVVGQAATGTGRVVLLHDGGGNRTATVEALPLIIDDLRARGFRFVTTHELLERPRAEIMPAATTVSAFAVALAHISWIGVRALSWVTEWLPAVAVVATLLGILRLGFIILFAHRHKRIEDARLDVAWRPPSVSVLVPAYNEEKVICKTIASLLRSPNGDFDIVVIDDGSSDGTAAIVRSTFAGNARIKVFTKANGGKSAALNFGLTHTSAHIVVAIDADTVLADDAIDLLLRHFGDPKVGAVAGSAVVGNQVTLMARFQALEYVTSQNLDRRALECFNAIGVVPGAIGAWRRDALLAVGGYSHDTLAEDADVTIAIERAGWKVLYEPRAVALTEAPETLRAFLKQRFRWMFGTLQVAYKHAGAVLTRRPSGVGLLTIPNILVFQFAFTLLAPLMDMVLILTVVASIRELIVHSGEFLPDDLIMVARYWLLFQSVDVLAAAAGIRLEARDRCWHLLPLLLLQRFCYRQLLYVVAIRTLLAAVKGSFVGWGKLLRTGNVLEQPAAPRVS